MTERDIVEILGYHRDRIGGGFKLINPDGPEAAAEILRLRAELAAARDAALEECITLAELTIADHVPDNIVRAFVTAIGALKGHKP